MTGAVDDLDDAKHMGKVSFSLIPVSPYIRDNFHEGSLNVVWVS